MNVESFVPRVIITSNTVRKRIVAAAIVRRGVKLAAGTRTEGREETRSESRDTRRPESAAKVNCSTRNQGDLETGSTERRPPFSRSGGNLILSNGMPRVNCAGPKNSHASIRFEPLDGPSLNVLSGRACNAPP